MFSGFILFFFDKRHINGLYFSLKSTHYRMKHQNHQLLRLCVDFSSHWGFSSITFAISKPGYSEIKDKSKIIDY